MCFGGGGGSQQPPPPAPPPPPSKMDEDAAARAAQVELIRERQRSGMESMFGTSKGAAGLDEPSQNKPPLKKNFGE